MTIYQEHGYQTRQEYLRGLSEEYGVDFESVLTIAELLGPDEDFDGLITMLEDLEIELEEIDFD